ncbi:unnamed protein product [Protopolystoma xenopodis]|uniref:Uncharacterized protein n=1 Tax=Protopolystoma xenopodis TaxID=117903 RepID=A0A448WF48_9PLAT|nr:unnamed protein product [Protopolystoma xenopodis]
MTDLLNSKLGLYQQTRGQANIHHDEVVPLFCNCPFRVVQLSELVIGLTRYHLSPMLSSILQLTSLQHELASTFCRPSVSSGLLRLPWILLMGPGMPQKQSTSQATGPTEFLHGIEELFNSHCLSGHETQCRQLDLLDMEDLAKWHSELQQMCSFSGDKMSYSREGMMLLHALSSSAIMLFTSLLLACVSRQANLNCTTFRNLVGLPQ